LKSDISSVAKGKISIPLVVITDSVETKDLSDISSVAKG